MDPIRNQKYDVSLLTYYVVITRRNLKKSLKNTQLSQYTRLTYHKFILIN